VQRCVPRGSEVATAVRRFYRDCCDRRFQSFIVRYRETDLWIGVDKFDPAMSKAVLDLLQRLYEQFLELAKVSPRFFCSLEPVQLLEGPSIALKMAQAANRANVGPTAAVAGAIADEVGQLLLKEFNCNEVVVENGETSSSAVRDRSLHSSTLETPHFPTRSR